MFVRAEMIVNTCFDVAHIGLSELAGHDSLTRACESAYGDGLAGLARVGSARAAGVVSTLVGVYARDLVTYEDRAVLTIRWEAAGAGGGVFPALDADITLISAAAGSSRLAIDGAYRPPICPHADDPCGTLLNGVAAPTVRSLLGRIAALIAVREPARRGR
jgi:hypothetical protein